jgi:putative iron-dependent peroxidase
MFIGRPPGTYDRILDFSTAVTGNLFFVPPAALLEDLPEEMPEEIPEARAAGDGMPGSLGIGSLAIGKIRGEP